MHLSSGLRLFKRENKKYAQEWKFYWLHQISFHLINHEVRLELFCRTKMPPRGVKEKLQAQLFFFSPLSFFLERTLLFLWICKIFFYVWWRFKNATMNMTKDCDLRILSFFLSFFLSTHHVLVLQGYKFGSSLCGEIH